MNRLAVSLFCIVLPLSAALAGRAVDINEEVEAPDVEKIEVTMELGAGHFELARGAGKGKLAQFVGQIDESKFDYQLRYKERRNSGRLSFTTETVKGYLSDIDKGDNDWKFLFSGDYHYSFDIDIGAAEMDFDFGGLAVTDMTIDVGAVDAEIAFSSRNKAEMRLLEIDAGACDLEVLRLGNARFSEFVFDGGVGSFLLDFTGEFDFEAEAEISVGLGSIEIILPKDVGVRLHLDDGLFSAIDFPKRDFRRVGRKDVYETVDFDEANGQLILYLDIGMGSADIDFE